MKNLFVFLTLLFVFMTIPKSFSATGVSTSVGEANGGTVVQWSGNFAKSLLPNLNLKDQFYIVPGSSDPTVSAVSAPAGSIYSRSNGSLYVKLDNGSSTNWSQLASGSFVSSVFGRTGAVTAQASDYSSFYLAQSDSYVSKKLYVDMNAPGSYTPDGSILRPFKTIMAAVNQVITNADNASHLYMIDIAPGAYAENVVLENAALSQLEFDCREAASISPASGLSLRSQALNDNLQTLTFKGCNFAAGITLTGASNGTNFLTTGTIEDATLFGNLSVSNAVSLSIYQSKTFANLAVSNTGIFLFSGGDGQAPGTTYSVSTVAGNQPAGFSLTQSLFERTIAGGDTTCGAGSLCMWRIGTRVGYPGGSISCAGTCQAYSSFFRSNVTVSAGGSFSDRGSFYASPITNSGGTVSEDGGVYKLLVNGASDLANAGLSIKDSHIQSAQTTAPTASVQAGAGLGATCTLSHATDSAGQINLTVGTATFAAGAQCTVSFNKSYNVAPIVEFSPANEQAASDGGSAHHIYATSTTAGFSINFGVQPNSVGASYVWTYHVIETQ